jgi:hypothetical protein
VGGSGYAPTLFAQVRVNPEFGFIEWPNGVGVCPDTLYEEAHRTLAFSPSVHLSLRVGGCGGLSWQRTWEGQARADSLQAGSTSPDNGLD